MKVEYVSAQKQNCSDVTKFVNHHHCGQYQKHGRLLQDMTINRSELIIDDRGPASFELNCRVDHDRNHEPNSQVVLVEPVHLLAEKLDQDYRESVKSYQGRHRHEHGKCSRIRGDYSGQYACCKYGVSPEFEQMLRGYQTGER